VKQVLCRLRQIIVVKIIMIIVTFNNAGVLSKLATSYVKCMKKYWDIQNMTVSRLYSYALHWQCTFDTVSAKLIICC